MPDHSAPLPPPLPLHSAVPATPPNVPAGLATYLGVAVAVLSGVAAVAAGIDGNDTATATGGAVAALAALATIGGRMAQAVAAVRAVTASPWIDVFQAALAATPPPSYAAQLRSADDPDLYQRRLDELHREMGTSPQPDRPPEGRPPRTPPTRASQRGPESGV